MNYVMTAALVRSILTQWRAYQWTVQGMGMVRTKIAGVGRIHVWDNLCRTSRVSDVHTHPWHLQSTVIAGELVNQRFEELGKQETTGRRKSALPYKRSKIACGEGGGLRGEAEETWLWPLEPDLCLPGDTYSQEPAEIHRSIPQDGTVTLIQRTQGPPLEEAVVYWPRGTEWISAEPRPADAWMVEAAVNYALSRWTA